MKFQYKFFFIFNIFIRENNSLIYCIFQITQTIQWTIDFIIIIIIIIIAFFRRLSRNLAVTIRWSEDTPSKEEYASQFIALFFYFLFIKT